MRNAPCELLRQKFKFLIFYRNFCGNCPSLRRILGRERTFGFNPIPKVIAALVDMLGDAVLVNEDEEDLLQGSSKRKARKNAREPLTEARYQEVLNKLLENDNPPGPVYHIKGNFPTELEAIEQRYLGMVPSAILVYDELRAMAQDAPTKSKSKKQLFIVDFKDIVLCPPRIRKPDIMTASCRTKKWYFTIGKRQPKSYFLHVFGRFYNGSSAQFMKATLERLWKRMQSIKKRKHDRLAYLDLVKEYAPSFYPWFPVVPHDMDSIYDPSEYERARQEHSPMAITDEGSNLASDGNSNSSSSGEVDVKDVGNVKVIKEANGEETTGGDGTTKGTTGGQASSSTPATGTPGATGAAGGAAGGTGGGGGGKRNPFGGKTKPADSTLFSRSSTGRSTTGVSSVFGDAGANDPKLLSRELSNDSPPSVLYASPRVPTALPC